MADLSSNFVGIKSPNPFWLASAPPTDKEYNVRRAFEAGWGGVVWKTLGPSPPIVNVNGPRYGAVLRGRPPAAWAQQYRADHRPAAADQPARDQGGQARLPDRALVVSSMVPCEEPAGTTILPTVEDDRRRRDRAELRLPARDERTRHGRRRRAGAGIYRDGGTAGARLRPDAGDREADAQHHRHPLPGPRGAKAGGADAVSLINTVSSITLVNLDTMSPEPSIDGKGSHGGYCGPAVKPIALNMVAEIARDAETAGLPISGIGGITTWRDAAEFLALGAGNVQVCTAAMTYGFGSCRR